MTESKKISGVDPNSYGAFDKSVDWMSKHLKVILPVVTMGSAAMAACDKLATENPPAETATLPSSATPTPFVEVTPTVEATTGAELLTSVDQLNFEREIPQLSQKEMSDIVTEAHRFIDGSGNVYALGYIPQSSGYFGMEAILIDLEKSSNQIEGDEFWRLLLVTEAKKAGGSETNDEKKYLIVPVYSDNDQAKKYRIALTITPGGAPSTDGGAFVQMNTAYSALSEQKEKYGNFQIFVTTITVDKDYLEMLKKTDNWIDFHNRAMRNFESSEDARKFEEYMLNNDYDGAAGFLKNNKPLLYLNSIEISSD